MRREGGGVERHRCEPAARAGGGPERLSADCQANTVGWEAPAVRPRVVKCAACGSRFALALTEPLVTKDTADRRKARTEPYKRPWVELSCRSGGSASAARSDPPRHGRGKTCWRRRNVGTW